MKIYKPDLFAFLKFNNFPRRMALPNANSYQRVSSLNQNREKQFWHNDIPNFHKSNFFVFNSFISNNALMLLCVPNNVPI